MTGKNTEAYDLLMIGGGMVGASFACMLQSAAGAPRFRAALIESSEISPDQAMQASFDARSTALAANTVNTLHKLGLWQPLSGQASAIRRIRVSEQGRFGALTLDCEEEGMDALGYVVENQTFGRILNQALTRQDSFDVLSPASVSAVSRVSGGYRVLVKAAGAEQELFTRLLILAEGGRSGLCQQLGIHRSTENYQQTAIVCNVACSRDHQQFAFERFTPEGPLALLPLPAFDNSARAALVWTRSPDQAARLLQADEQTFLAELQEAFGDRLGVFTRAGQRFLYPVSLERAAEQIRSGLVLLGNVAQTLHPVAGQGFNLAFRNAMQLAAVLREALLQGRDPGSYAVLEGYQQAVQTDQQLTIAFSHHLTRLFSNDRSALSSLRLCGLLGMELLPQFRHMLNRQAMGLAGSAPRL